MKTAPDNQATRLAKLRTERRLTTREVADGIHNIVTHTRIHHYENEPNAKIKPDVLNSLAKFYNVTPDFIRYGNPVSRQPFNAMPPRQIITDNMGREVILRVPAAAHVGYIQHVGDQEYLGDLKAYSLPGFENGTFRMFEVKGDSMMPLFNPGDWVIGAHVEAPADIKNGNIYVIVTREGICLKRVTNNVDTKGVILIESENPAYKPDIIFKDDILEMWEFKAKITSVLGI